METAVTVREARERARLSQAELAALVGTSQATISAYESGRKQPSVATLSRLLAAMGCRLAVEPATQRVREPSALQMARAGEILVQVMQLAEALPVHHQSSLRFPRLSRAS